jgi:hypothetical protein
MSEHNKPDYPVCITSDTRPDPAHCWERAAVHCFMMKDLPYFVQRAAATECLYMAQAIWKIPRPPQRSVVQWGWGKGWPGQ